MDNQMTSLKCRKCGATVSADQKKCPKCGAPILLKVMMEEEKRHLPAKEIREKDKRMRKEYAKMNKEKELEKQKAEKKQQLLDEKAKKAEERAKKEQDIIREKEEKRAKKAEEKAKKAAVSEEKPERSGKNGLIIGIILAVLLLAGACTYAVITMMQKEPVEPAVTEETEELQEEPEITEDILMEEPQEDPQAEQQEEVQEEAPQETKDEPVKTEARNITRNNYLFPSDTQYLTDADVNGLSKFDTGLIRNEIFARKGYVFKDEPYKSYFNSQAWYTPNPSVKNPKLNEFEKYNVNFLLEYERSQGWR